jgi:poly-gamma-glutamate capsule biosynthesis protein CapA/YwtB (metallophosphatase superfamily)
VVFTGDILLGDAGAEVFRTRGFAHAFAHLHPLLAADHVVGNAEGPISEREPRPHPVRRWSYAADPRTATTLREVGFSALGLANNHAFDRGQEGLRDTLSHLERAGIVGFGAGPDEAAALRPLWIETPFGPLAVVGMASPTLHASPEARDGEPGVAVATPERIERVAREARAAGARQLVAYVHWGRNYRGIMPQQRALARLFADAGFDLVIGHHPHVVQPVERLGATWVLYSLGNLAFSTPGRFEEFGAPGYGLVARAYFGDAGLEAVELRCILTDNEVVRFRPRPCAAREAGSLLGELGDGIAVRGEVGVLVP